MKTNNLENQEVQFNQKTETHHTLEEILELLTQLRLGTAKSALKSCINEEYFYKMSFIDQMYEVLNPEVIKRKDSSFKNKLKKAKLRSNSTPSEIEESKKLFNLDSNMLEYLFSDKWVKSHKRFIIQGFCGTGKTSLATAILVCLMKLGYKTLNEDFSNLMFKLSVIKSTENTRVGYYEEKLKEIASNKVLLLDDFAIEDDQSAYAPILKNLLDECAYTGCELIITAQKGKAKWVQALGNNEIAEACVDRIRQNEILIKLTSDSLRAIKQGDEGDQLFNKDKGAVTNEN